MYDKTIKRIFSTDPIIKKWFKGFSNPDRPLPCLKKKPALVILNTDSYRGAGQHWCVVIFFNNRECEFFDPLGQRPDRYHFHHFLFQKCDIIKYNKFPIQSLTSVNCGHHCIFFAHHRARGLDPREIMFFYSKNDLAFNDQMVYTFIYENYGPKCANDGDPIGMLQLM
jgi:hypothetical protein